MSERTANVEIKARLADPAAALATALGLGADDRGQIPQTDTYFRTAAGRIKLREMPSGSELVVYLRPDGPGPRRSDYVVIPVPDPARAKDLLRATLGEEVVVRKVRHLLMLGDTRIHLDTVEGLATFLEFEAVHAAGNEEAEAAARADVERLMLAFGVRDEHLVPRSYREMMLEKKPRR